MSLRDKISASVESSFDRTLQSYLEFALEAPPQDAKGFAAHHAACKAALSHLELLLKLSEVNSKAEASSENCVPNTLLEEARAALAVMEGGEP